MQKKLILELLKEVSACRLKKEDVLFLNGLFIDKEVQITLLYRASIHGWWTKNFHDRCDNKGPSISLF